jgi:hypothetical protein
MEDERFLDWARYEFENEDFLETDMLGKTWRID